MANVTKGSVRMAAYRSLDEEPFVFDEAYAELAHQMQSLHIARVAEMPRIELYLDQVLSIISSELSFMYAPNEKIVTGAMVNNYVKQRIVPAPTRKRYTRRHIASLIFVCAFKRVLSISQIEQIILTGHELGVDLELAYEGMAGLLEQTIGGLFPDDPASHPTRLDGELQLVDIEGRRIGGTLERMLENAVFLLAYKVYEDRMLDLEARQLSPEAAE